MLGFFYGERVVAKESDIIDFWKITGFAYARFNNTPDRISRNAKRAFAIEYEKKLVHHLIIGEQGF